MNILKYLIVFYDRSSLKNLLPILAAAPDVVKFYYDAGTYSYEYIYSTYEACVRYLPNLKFEVGAMDEHDFQSLSEKLETFIEHTYPDEVGIDLTGGNELSVIAGYETALQCGCHVYHTDIWKNTQFHFNTMKLRPGLMPFELTDLITAFGGKLLGYTDDSFLMQHRSALTYTADYLLHHLNRWLRTCQYFQKHNSALRQNGSLHFRSKWNYVQGSSEPQPDKQILNIFYSQKLIDYLNITEKHVEFRYANAQFMDYISSYGVWLELFVYFQLLEFKDVHDVHTSLKIDWNRHDHVDIIGNEIDVTCMYHARPVIISCKQSTGPISADTLNELYVVSRRIGGKYAIPILMTCSDMRSKHLALYLKAEEMGIHLMDVSDILARDFKVRLAEIIRNS